MTNDQDVNAPEPVEAGSLSNAESAPATEAQAVTATPIAAESSPSNRKAMLRYAFAGLGIAAIAGLVGAGLGFGLGRITGGDHRYGPGSGERWHEDGGRGDDRFEGRHDGRDGGAGPRGNGFQPEGGGVAPGSTAVRQGRPGEAQPAEDPTPSTSAPTSSTTTQKSTTTTARNSTATTAATTTTTAAG